MTDAEKIKELNSLIDEIGKVIESNNKPDGIPGTILATNTDLLAMADMARLQIATLTSRPATERGKKMKLAKIILNGQAFHHLDYPGVAMELAMIAHEGQVDKAGDPYINHVARVVATVLPQIRFLELKDRHEALAAAWLHDVVEDADIDLYDIAIAFPGNVAPTINALTRRVGEVYADYILRVARSSTPAAQIIKRADLYDNRFRGTLPASMEQRYDRAIGTLDQDAP